MKRWDSDPNLPGTKPRNSGFSQKDHVTADKLRTALETLEVLYYY